jgi:hypothetical protein
MPTDPTPQFPAPTGRRLLRCDACGRTDDATHADLMRHTREGWPKCCGQMMDYLVASTAARCPTCGRVGGLTFPAAAVGPVRIVCTACALPPAALQ